VKDEPVDVLDKQGRKTGQILMKSRVHAQSCWHAVAHLWIYNSNDEFLLQKRAPNKQVWPNVWDVTIAGHIEAGDTPQNTVVREAQEEMAIKIEPQNISLFKISKFEGKMPGGWTNRVYISSFITKMDLKIADLKLQKEEVSRVRWVKIDELKKELLDPAMDRLFSPPAKIFFHSAIAEARKRDGQNL
jgi:isopentenyl-diphosphate delta-isomerase